MDNPPDAPIDRSPAWTALAEHARQMHSADLRVLFGANSDRATRFTRTAGDLTIDFSKHLIDDKSLELLIALADTAKVSGLRDSMFAGEPINITEGRSVLHTALRSQAPVMVDGRDAIPDVRTVLERMTATTEQVRNGQWTGATGDRIRTIINIGIGGSDLGPLMVTRALRHIGHPDLDVRFVSNVDGAHLEAALEHASPASTLFVIASKTFTTIETMTNARSARSWLLAGLDTVDEAAVSQHFVALSTNAERVAEFGIDPVNMFPFWDWVGGRYSVGSSIGFAAMCSMGADAFRSFLDGFRVIDDHFSSAPLIDNAPALAGLLGIWYRNFFGWQTHAVLPYSQALARFPAYLQQLDMESNGKRIRRDGGQVDADTAAIVWGEPGTNGQHAFYQLLHQGTTRVPCDFIGFLEPEPALVQGVDRHEHHRLLFANMVAQSEALAFGRTADEVRSEGIAEPLVEHRTFPGNRPSTVITAPALTPSVLGQLIAFYEHRVFTQGAVWGINSFDQWGVELGKVLATAIDAELSGDANKAAHDSSTNALIAAYRTHHQ